MNKFISVLIFLYVSAQILSAETWTLESRDNRTIEVDYLFYDGVDLTIQRVGDYRKINLTPDQLSEKCWKEIEKEFSAKAAIELEVTRKTKTSTETERENYSGYYDTYTSSRKEIEKINRFIIDLSSSTYFNSKVTVEYFIFADGEVEYGRVPAELSMRKPFQTQVEKTLASTTYKSSSTYYGTYYKSGTDDSTASIGVILLNSEGEEIEEYASSEKLRESMHSIKNKLRESYTPPAKPKSNTPNRKKGKDNALTIE